MRSFHILAKRRRHADDLLEVVFRDFGVVVVFLVFPVVYREGDGGLEGYMC